LAAGCGLLGAIVLAALVGPLVVTADPNAIDLEQRLLPPGALGLGTDHLGRDLAARLLHGARTTLLATALLFAALTATGVTVGAVAGYAGGLLDRALMAVTDVVLAFPGLLLAVAIAGTLGPGMESLLLALALVGWANQTRLVRGLVLAERAEAYVLAAQALGAPPARVVIRHLLRNVAGPLLALTATDLGRIITSLASLSFLGLGAQPPTPEWGAMLSEARPFLQSHPHLLLYPAVAVCVTIGASGLLAEGLRALNDPLRGGTAGG